MGAFLKGLIEVKKLPVQVIFREYFEGIMAAVFLALFLRFFVFSVLYIPSENMEPGLVRGDFVIGWKLVYGFPIPLKGGKRLNAKMPKRGEVVSLRFPGDEEQTLIRRVVGVPGDKIHLEGGEVFINGESAEYIDRLDAITEHWKPDGVMYDLKKPLRGNMKPLVVPEGHFFVLTDNRVRSDDSRNWGLVPIENIESRLAYIWLSIASEDGGLGFRWSRIFSKIH